MRYRISLTLLALLLAGCGNDAADKAKGAGTAAGEILPGSASDAMVPLDQVKSQAPLAPKAEASDKPDAKAADKAKVAAPDETSAPTAAEPAEAAAED